VVVTAWSCAPSQTTRYRVTGSPAAPDACRVVFTRVWQGLSDPADHASARDWQMELALLQAVAPADAARLEAGAPGSKPAR
jgi:hypothetical protein